MLELIVILDNFFGLRSSKIINADYSTSSSQSLQQVRPPWVVVWGWAPWAVVLHGSEGPDGAASEGRQMRMWRRRASTVIRQLYN